MYYANGAKERAKQARTVARQRGLLENFDAGIKYIEGRGEFVTLETDDERPLSFKYKSENECGRFSYEGPDPYQREDDAEPFSVNQSVNQGWIVVPKR